MKSMKWMLALLAAVIVTVPAFAQSQDPHAKEKWENGKLISAAIERAAVKAVREHKASHCPQCDAQYTIDEKYHGVKHECAPAEKDAPNACARCGQEVRPGQHCAAADYNALCAASEPQPAEKEQAQNEASHCPKCGAKYTVDEKYHGVKHHCRPAAEQHSIQHCIFCGEPIESEFQSCQAVKGGYCTVQCPDCGKNLRDPKNLTQGEHRCKFKTRIVPAEPKAIEK